MKITRKTTAQELKDFLTANAANVKAVDENLSSMVDYTLSHDAKRQDLIDLAKQVITTLGDKIVDAMTTPAAAETAPKGVTEVQTSTEDTTTAKPEVKKSAPKGDTKPTTENLVKKTKKNSGASAPAPEESADEKSKKSSGGKKTAKKPADEGAVTALEMETTSPKAVQLAKMFPETIEVDGETYRVDHEVKTIADLEDGDFEFAFYWTKRHLRQFPYFNGWLGQPKSFNKDIDTAQLIYVSDDGRVAYCVSDATEAVYTVLPADLEEVDGMRIGSGSSIEFQIYRKVEDETDTDDDTEDEDDET